MTTAMSKILNLLPGAYNRLQRVKQRRLQQKLHKRLGRLVSYGLS